MKMPFKEGLIRARSHIIFLVGLLSAFGLVAALERWDVAPPSPPPPRVEITPSADIPTVTPMPLNADEQRWARIAWQYFENNYRPETGLVNSVDGYTASTMWDTASYLMALISAYRLQLIAQDTFDQRLRQALTSLARLPLFDNRLPHKSYNTVSLAMVTYTNEETERGIGWSAIDIGRLLVPCNIIMWNYPEHSHQVQALMRRWELGYMLRDGVLYGAGVDPHGNTIYHQEGRIGYEEYAAKSLTLMGLDVAQALRYDDFLHWVEVYGLQIPTDSRDHIRFKAHNYVVSESYILDGIEFGGDTTSREFAYRVYKAQEARFEHQGILTAVSEDNLDQPPYFVYNTVFTDGKAWNAITESGQDASAFKTLSVKAAFGWHALFRTPYTQRLMDAVQPLHDPQRGWYAGRYEHTQTPNTALTANTNAIILESLAYKQFGRLVSLYPATSAGWPQHSGPAQMEEKR